MLLNLLIAHSAMKKFNTIAFEYGTDYSAVSLWNFYH